MGMPEQQIAQNLAQQIAGDPGVSWEIFKYAIGLILAYITGAYGLMWKLFMLFRGEIKSVRENDVKHLENRVAKLERGKK